VARVEGQQLTWRDVGGEGGGGSSPFTLGRSRGGGFYREGTGRGV
jgi:hypothetical protein